MSNSVRTFVDLWVQSHIRAEGYQAKDDTRLARALAHKCVEVAQTKGISAKDIEAEVGDIFEYVHGQIKRVNYDLAMTVRDIDKAIDQQLEEGLIDSFPASDPVSMTQSSKSRFEAR